MSDVHGTTDRALWCAVIAQALEDATRPLPAVGSSLYTRRYRERVEARNYFAKVTPDFQHVCNLAGLEPQALIALAQERISIADAHKRAPKPKPAKVNPQARLYTVNGISLPLREWSKRLNVSQGTLVARIRKGWPLEIALTPQTYRTRSRGGQRQPISQTSTNA